MSFVKKSKPPPILKEGEIRVATITSIEYPVSSQFTDDKGTPKQQIRFDLILEDGYIFRDWLAYYPIPRDTSKLGRLCVTLDKLVEKDLQHVNEALETLKEIGKVFVICRGTRKWNEKIFPKLKIVVDRLPPLQTEISPTKTVGPSAETVDFIKNSKEIVVRRIPMNETDWNTHVSATVRAELLKLNLVQKEEGLYFFSEQAQKFL